MRRIHPLPWAALPRLGLPQGSLPASAYSWALNTKVLLCAAVGGSLVVAMGSGCAASGVREQCVVEDEDAERGERDPERRPEQRRSTTTRMTVHCCPGTSQLPIPALPRVSPLESHHPSGGMLVLHPLLSTHPFARPNPHPTPQPPTQNHNHDLCLRMHHSHAGAEDAVEALSTTPPDGLDALCPNPHCMTPVPEEVRQPCV